MSGTRVKYLLNDKTLSLTPGKIYNVVKTNVECGGVKLVSIIDNTGEEYGFPMRWFEIQK